MAKVCGQGGGGMVTCCQRSSRNPDTQPRQPHDLKWDNEIYWSPLLLGFLGRTGAKQEQAGKNQLI
jgi:hypothetical protein